MEADYGMINSSLSRNSMLAIFVCKIMSCRLQVIESDPPITSLICLTYILLYIQLPKSWVSEYLVHCGL